VEKLANWLQVGANFGLLAGLVLVAIQVNQNSSQLQQSHELTRAGLTNHTFDIWAAIDSTSQSEQFALALSKSLERPEELTLAEVMELDGYLNTIMWHLTRIRKLNEMGVFREGIDGLVESIVLQYFSSKFARAWWEENRGYWHVELVTVLEKKMEDVSADHRLTYFNQLRSHFQ